MAFGGRLRRPAGSERGLWNVTGISTRNRCALLCAAWTLWGAGAAWGGYDAVIRTNTFLGPDDLTCDHRSVLV
ncbi:MAG: hypothetical protein JW951_04660, partial [Lentisphaerae bacterium]|nr:hypothetical protein [Lentisphaerota bacterium]